MPVSWKSAHQHHAKDFPVELHIQTSSHHKNLIHLWLQIKQFYFPHQLENPRAHELQVADFDYKNFNPPNAGQWHQFQIYLRRMRGCYRSVGEIASHKLAYD